MFVINGIYPKPNSSATFDNTHFIYVKFCNKCCLKIKVLKKNAVIYINKRIYKGKKEKILWVCQHHKLD